MASKDAPVAEEQWASRVVSYSSQYNDHGWGAAEVVGEPRVYPRYGDLQGAWAQRILGSQEYIELEFARPMRVSEVHIYETLNAGAVTGVKLRDPSGQWQSVYQGAASVITQSRVFKPALAVAEFAAREVRLELDCTAAGSWCEIDAVKLCGAVVPETDQGSRDSMVELWAHKVIGVSSEYPGWPAADILGEPKIYPTYGEISAGSWKTGAWAHLQYASSSEFIEVEFARPLVVREVCVYEVLCAGGITKIQLRAPSGHWCTVYQGQPTCLRQSREFKPTLQVTEFETSQVRLELNCSVSQSWCEIDAVKIRGHDELGPEPPATGLATDLGRLVNDARFSDVELSVEGQTLRAHRVILASRCDYFRAMLDCQPLPQRLEIPNVSGAAMLGILQYIYTNDVHGDTPDSALIEIVRVGERFSLDYLGRLCLKRLQQRMTAENVITMYLEADKQPTLEYMKKQCVAFITRHLKTVSQSPDFASLPQPTMLSLLQASVANLELQ